MEIPELVGVEARPDFRVWVKYSNGAEGDVDFSHLVGKGVFQLWDDYSNFEKVDISPSGAIAWSDVVEVCPDATYMRLTGMRAQDMFLDIIEPLTHAGA